MNRRKVTPTDQLTDGLAIRAATPGTLSDGKTVVTHFGSFLPFSIDEENGTFVASHDSGVHKIDDFDWCDGRYQV